MSSTWSAVNTAGTGVTVNQTWIDTISSNVANMNDAVTPGQPVYRAQSVNAGQRVGPSGPWGPGADSGVQVNAIELGSAKGRMQYEPNNPLANAEGLVEYPAVDLATQMTSLIQAQTSYQANAKVMSNAKDAYQAILNIKA
ncbi:MAG TPA: flagellar basal body rod C-terminal domain-containing protein [Candidatus Paceibacterota bacterium]|nr:flagellar basal body rod C-terminal domain-containing protein [Candidatus Paceibacterota bacterium]